ncbi:Alpha/Beta hydrolase protein [Cladorrhinum samala]|uniref:Alpha/Beta hydrolase protein n=1 Tax=Cladorrhinum samala TaxID=585594 RepID=A0AAV9HJH3_9PEZI|nr:Alpha/Beta hydrolase protein [Cladorrhinum samala]
MEFDLTEGTVHNEGCDLRYWTTTGKDEAGPLITFIPGGNGHGCQFFPLMAALSKTANFTCATFDRRQMSGSQLPGGVESNKLLNPPQQARDVRAVIRAAGFERSIIFGSSSGGILAFQFAHDFPEAATHVIAHEAPTFMLLPDASELFEWFLHLTHLHKNQGLEAAAAEFESKLVGYDDEGVPPVVKPDARNRVNFWEYEIPILGGGYTPNLWRIRANGTSVGVMQSVRCREAFFARAPAEQAKILGCPVWVVPGHHQGFEAETEEFLPSFLEALDALERAKVAAARG